MAYHCANTGVASKSFVLSLWFWVHSGHKCMYRLSTSIDFYACIISLHGTFVWTMPLLIPICMKCLRKLFLIYLISCPLSWYYMFLCYFLQLERMMEMRVKAEIQSLSKIRFDFLTRVYLPNKIQHSSWLWYYVLQDHHFLSLHFVCFLEVD